MRLLYIIQEYFPTERPDVHQLFGVELRRLGVETDVIAQAAKGRGRESSNTWPGGAVFIHGRERRGMFAYLVRPWFDAAVLYRARSAYDLVQVRDKIRSGILAWIAARLVGKPFVYWMSFPWPEGYFEVYRQRSEAPFAVRLFAWVRAVLAREALYRFLLRKADWIFVQSEAMAKALEDRGLPIDRVTAVPMGVDASLASPTILEAIDDDRLRGRRVIVYLGSLNSARQPMFLLEVLQRLKERWPDILLLLVGGGEDREEDRLREEVNARGLARHVLITGWLSRPEALRYTRAAEVGLSPIPRGALYDVSSPTKCVEYLALAIPCVGSDIPDQKLVIEQSGGGRCVPMESDHFADAISDLLTHPAHSKEMGRKGRSWVVANRDYSLIARRVFEAYSKIADR